MNNSQNNKELLEQYIMRHFEIENSDEIKDYLKMITQFILEYGQG